MNRSKLIASTSKSDFSAKKCDHHAFDIGFMTDHLNDRAKQNELSGYRSATNAKTILVSTKKIVLNTNDIDFGASQVHSLEIDIGFQ